MINLEAQEFHLSLCVIVGQSEVNYENICEIFNEFLWCMALNLITQNSSQLFFTIFDIT